MQWPSISEDLLYILIPLFQIALVLTRFMEEKKMSLRTWPQRSKCLTRILRNILDLNETLIRNSIKVLKRVENDPAGQAQKFLSNGISATLIDLSKLVHNAGGAVVLLLWPFRKLQAERKRLIRKTQILHRGSF